MTPRDHLLRLLAPVAPGTRVAVVGSADGALAADLAALGLDVWACDAAPEAVEATRARLAEVLPDAAARATRAAATALGYPDSFSPWVALDLDRAEDPAEAFVEAARVVALGGWVRVASADPAALLGLPLPPDVVPVEVPKPLDGGAACLFRRVGDGVVA